MIINWLCLTEVVHVYLYGVPLLREREWELNKKKEKKKAFHLASSEQMLIPW